jgi:hypothetical protein
LGSFGSSERDASVRGVALVFSLAGLIRAPALRVLE